MTRRSFLKFVVIGGIVSFLSRRIKARNPVKQAKFWRRAQ